jgi:hypothetical protein
MKRLTSASGSVTPMVMIMAIGIFMVIGMAYDGGGQLDADQRATMLAQEAARAGAQAVDVKVYLATGVATINEAEARVAITAFEAQPGWPPQTAVTDVLFNASHTEIQVNISIQRNIVFLPSSVGKTVYGHAEVKLTQGVVDAGG